MSDKPREWNKSWSNCESHAHDNPGHWDSDNGDKSGTVCELCYRWNAFEEIDAENDKLLTEVMSLRLQKDPDIVDGVKDVTIAALKNTETRVRADRDKIREERDTLLKENERLRSKLSIADLKTHKEKTLRILALLNECDTLKAKLAEVEAERERLEDLLGAVHDTTLEADTKSRIANNLDATPNGWRFRKSQLTRERQAAKVMREALEQIQSLAANEHEQGDSKALDDVLDLTCETFKALAKADEIRGGGEE